MKKQRTILVLVLVVVLSISLSGCTNKESVIEDIAMPGSYVIFDYDELVDHSKIIDKIKVTDTLGTENSFAIKDPETGSTGGFYGKRTGQVVEYYKDSTGEFSEELSFIEAAAIINNQYLHIEGYEALKEVNEYIVFLSDGTASGDMSIISCNNGVVRLSADEESMNFADIAQRTIKENIRDIRIKSE